MPKKILIIEDNQEIADLLCLHLTDQAWAVDSVYDGNAGYKKALTCSHDLIILDVMLPGMDGMEILKQLRSQNILIPVLMLTSKSSEIDRILGLEFGADDYVTKPFSIREVISRIKAIFRRIENIKNSEQGEISSFGDLKIDSGKRKVLIQEREIELTAKEYDLLSFFSKHPGRVFTRSELLDKVWGYGHDGYEHTVNSNINRLRSKIEINPAKPGYILTVWGVGYKFRDT